MNQPFKELDGGTVFMAQQYWLYKDETTGQAHLYSTVGVWPWENVLSVQTLDERTLPALAEPRCAVELPGQYLYLSTDFQTVLTAWRRWRLRHAPRSLTFTTPS